MLQQGRSWSFPRRVDAVAITQRTFEWFERQEAAFVRVVGRSDTKPIVRTIGETHVTEFTVLVHNSHMDKPLTFKVVTFNALAQWCSTNIVASSRVHIEGYFADDNVSGLHIRAVLVETLAKDGLSIGYDQRTGESKR